MMNRGIRNGTSWQMTESVKKWLRFQSFVR
jgi:hypothetical protein